MKIKRFFNGKKLLAAGILGVLAVCGSSAVQAAEEKNEALKTVEAPVDAQGAEKIALTEADVTAEEAERLSTKADWEDGEAVYEVTFAVNDIEYEYLIRESDGVILEWEIEGRNLGDVTAEWTLEAYLKDAEEIPETGLEDVEEIPEAGLENTEEIPEEGQSVEKLIGIRSARKIAFADAGLEAEDVSVSKLKFEKGGRRDIYEIEFKKGRDEFEYTIDACSGEVIKMERD